MNNQRITTPRPMRGLRLIQPPAKRPSDGHILVPTSLHPSDGPALTLATQWASQRRATLTLLYVAPYDEDWNPVHWLDALVRLHQAFAPRGAPRIASTGGKFVGGAREAAWSFFAETVPEDLRGAAEVRVVCRTGDFADQVARYANDSDADLVVMACDRSSWWLPFLPAEVRRVLQLTQKQVVLVPPSL